MAIRLYKNEVRIYNNSPQQGNLIVSDCNRITFINSGQSPVKILGMLLTPNQSFTFPGNEDELDTTVYDFTFTNLTLTQEFTVVRKYIVLTDAERVELIKRLQREMFC